MAIDVGLMDRARETGEAVFRLYSWVRPTVSFGRNQTAIGRYDRARLAAEGVDVVRRPTGGRAILHHREITYSVTAPATDAVGLRASYARINTVLLDALRAIGVPVALAEAEGRALQPTDAPCFVTPSAGEMTVKGHKLVGSAQWRDNGALLQHGSILIDDDQSTLPRFMLSPPEAVPPAGTLRQVLGRAPGPEELLRGIAGALQRHEGAFGAPIDPETVIASGTTHLVEFEGEQWTWRR